MTLEDGTDITPGSTLRQAILAVLIAAPRQIRARKSLQDMFWADAEPDRAAANLRTAVYLLRQDLAALGPDILLSDRQTLSLGHGRLRPTPADYRGPDFLEGMDLALVNCEGFEDWLREMRTPPFVPPAEDRAPAIAPASATLLKSQPAHVALGLLPPIHAGLPPLDLLRAEALTDAIAHCIAQATLLDIHDLRGLDAMVVPLPLKSGKGVTHSLRTVVERNGQALTLRLRLHDAASRRLIWVSQPMDARVVEDPEAAYRLSETLLDRLRAEPAASGAPDLFPLSAIAALFSLNDALVSETEAQLEHMLDNGGPPILECLRAYTQVFKVNEGFGLQAPFDATSLCELLARVPASDPLLPLCQSLVGYSVHMLLAENDLANHLVESAFQRAPQMALNLDHLAVLRLIRGDLDGAETAFRQCMNAGAFSPWRYTYEVTGAMIYLAKGDFRQSLYHANQALFRQPRFLGALRYAMSGLALSDKVLDARRMLGRIQSLRPDYDLSAWAEGIMRRTPPELGTTLVQSLQRNAIL